LDGGLMENSNMLDAILERTSIRNFEKDRKVPEEFVKKILLAGIRAPSAGNIQPRTIIVVRNEVVKEQLYQLCEDQAFMKAAPLWIVMCVDLHRHLKAAELTGVEYDYTGILPYSLGVLDAALSLENMVIAAETLSLGSVMIGSVIEHPEEARRILELPGHCLALCILCVGYPKRRFGRREKWDYEVIVCDDRYKDIDTTDVAEYWKKFILSDLKRGGKEISPEVLERICNERNYGKRYASHYTQEFINVTNRKLMKFLNKQGLLKR
jgi:nitroreductase